MSSSQSVSPPKAVDDMVLSNVGNSLTKAREQLSNSATVLKDLVWKPTHDNRVDTLVRKTACMSLAYRDDILPKSKKLVTNLQCFLEMYVELEFNEFLEVLPDMIKMAVEYAEQANDVSGLHISLGGALTELEKKAERTESLLKKDIAVHDQEQKDHKKRLKAIYLRRSLSMACVAAAGACVDVAGGSGAGSAIAMAVNAVVYKHMGQKAENRQGKADETAASLQIANNAVEKLTDELLRCISDFRDAMATLAGFFTLLHHELDIYGDKLGRLRDNPVLVHFKLVNKKAQEIIKGCKAFVLLSSQVEIDLRAIELMPGVKPDKRMLPPPTRVIIQEIEDDMLLQDAKEISHCITDAVPLANVRKV